MTSNIEKQRLCLEKRAGKVRNLQNNVSKKPHLPIFPNASKEEIFIEYTNFLRNMPRLVEGEQQKVINSVKTYLKIGPILDNIHDLNFDNLLHIKEGSRILDYMSVEYGRSLNILCPPITNCLLCGKNLQLANKATQVAVHTLTGPVLYSKYIYRCRGCHLTKAKDSLQTKARQDVFYHHDRVRNTLELSKP